MLRIGEVARMLGIHSNTVRNWSDKGLLPAYYIGPRGDRRFKRNEVEDYLRKVYKRKNRR